MKKQTKKWFTKYAQQKIAMALAKKKYRALKPNGTPEVRVFLGESRPGKI